MRLLAASFLFLASTAFAAEPTIILIHGLGDAEGMGQMKSWLDQRGFSRASVHHHLESLSSLASFATTERENGHRIAIVGHSQGGFQAVYLARKLEETDQQVSLLFTMASGGLGRLLPQRWFAGIRRIPANVAVAINAFADGDILGWDLLQGSNYIEAVDPEATNVDNIQFKSVDGVDHLDFPLCSEHGGPEALRTRLCERLISQLRAL